MFEDDEKPGFVDPVADVYMDGNRQLVFIETPAMDEKSVETEVKDGVLEFTARKNTARPAGRKYFQMERPVGMYLKKIPLAFRNMEVKEICHSYKFGVIKIEIIFSEEK